MPKPSRPAFLRLRLGPAALVLALSGVLLGFLPVRTGLEEEMGLGLLYALRGPQTPPDNVVIVGIDHESAVRLQAPDEPQAWPRQLHAQIIQAAHKGNAAAVGFAIFFAAASADPAADRDMAAAMRSMGRVVITDYVKPRQIHAGVYVEVVVEPTPELAAAALATAPFLLPRNAHRASQFLTFFGGSEERATLPTILLLAQIARYGMGDLISVTEGTAPQLSGLLAGQGPRSGAEPPLEVVRRALAKTLRSHPDLSADLLDATGNLRLPEASRRLLSSLFRVHGNGAVRYFNHYGPARSFRTIPYHELGHWSAERLSATLRDRIVLVGYLEDFQPENAEGVFYSPYSPVSSVELAATAVANLLEDRSVRPLLPPLLEAIAYLLWGLLLGGLARLVSLRRALGAIVLLGGAYLVGAWWLFRSDGYWLPLVIPLGWQVPLALLATVLLNYQRYARREEKLHSVINRFIPVDVFRQLTGQHDVETLPAYGRLARGVCLVTDAGRYTALAETLEPMVLARLMNQYYEAIFRPVTRRGGWISDVLGDAMMAIWIADEGEPACSVALEAAAEILQAVRDFEREHRLDFPVRIGIHCGELRIGYVGTAERGEIRAVGDTVNTAARLEALNRLLGTQILLSEAVLNECPGAPTRPMGQFLLAGKSKPVAVAQLLTVHDLPPVSAELNRRFAGALSLIAADRWEDAQAAFTRLSLQFPQDGPTRFYCKRCQSRLADPEAAGSGIAVGKPDPAQPLTK